MPEPTTYLEAAVPLAPTCRICLFFDGVPPVAGVPGRGICRRYAPQPHRSDDEPVHWPTVTADEWCGEFQPMK